MDLEFGLRGLVRAYVKILSGECEYLRPEDLTRKTVCEWKRFIRKWNGGKR